MDACLISIMSNSLFPITISNRQSKTFSNRLPWLPANSASRCVQCQRFKHQLTNSSQGSIHKGVPQGKEEIIHGLNTYIIGNRINPRGIIVIYSDIFGLSLANNKLIADSYAKNGEWLVYLPDFFKGDPMSLKFADVAIPVDASKQSSLSKFTGLLATVPGLLLWMSRHKQEPTDKICMDFLGALRRDTPRTRKIGIVGFCWQVLYSTNVIYADYLTGAESMPFELGKRGT
jgi:hypothetical protein